MLTTREWTAAHHGQLAAAIAATPLLEFAELGEPDADDLTGGRGSCELRLAPTHTTSEARVRALLAAAAGLLDRDDRPCLSVTTEDATVVLNADAFPVAEVGVTTRLPTPTTELEMDVYEQVEIDGNAFEHFYVDQGFFMPAVEFTLASASGREQLAVLLPAVERQRAAARVRIANAIDVFFTAET